MKPFACCCAVWLGLAALAPARAGTPPPAVPPEPFSLGAFASYWELSGLDGLDVAGAPGGGIVGHFRLPAPFAVELRLSGYAARDSRTIVAADGAAIDNRVTIVAMPLEMNVLVEWPLGEVLRLYGGPGAGFYLFDGQSNNHRDGKETVYDIEVDDEFGAYALAGLRAQLFPRLAVFVEARYAWIETSVEKATDVRTDIGIDWVAQTLDFSGFAANAGLLFTF